MKLGMDVSRMQRTAYHDGPFYCICQSVEGQGVGRGFAKDIRSWGGRGRARSPCDPLERVYTVILPVYQHPSACHVILHTY